MRSLKFERITNMESSQGRLKRLFRKNGGILQRIQQPKLENSEFLKFGRKSGFLDTRSFDNLKSLRDNNIDDGIRRHSRKRVLIIIALEACNKKERKKANQFYVKKSPLF
jgi:hypothetical protein